MRDVDEGAGRLPPVGRRLGAVSEPTAAPRGSAPRGVADRRRRPGAPPLPGEADGDPGGRRPSARRGSTASRWRSRPGAVRERRHRDDQDGTMPGELWQRYRDTADPDARRQLLELYIGLVHHVAREMGRRTKAVELDDLVSAGTFGLIRALDSFDLSRGLAFSTYAVRRIRGAILDDLRSQDWAPRAVRVKARRLQVATTALEYRLGRSPRARRSRGAARHRRLDLLEMARRHRLPHGRVVRGRGGRPCHRPDGSAGAAGGPQHPHTGGGARPPRGDPRSLRDAIARLPEKERTVMALYYYEELNQRQIAEVMHVTESRVSQIRTQALKRLRSRLVPAGGTQ